MLFRPFFLVSPLSLQPPFHLLPPPFPPAPLKNVLVCRLPAGVIHCSTQQQSTTWRTRRPLPLVFAPTPVSSLSPSSLSPFCLSCSPFCLSSPSQILSFLVKVKLRHTKTQAPSLPPCSFHSSTTEIFIVKDSIFYRGASYYPHAVTDGRAHVWLAPRKCAPLCCYALFWPLARWLACWRAGALACWLVLLRSRAATGSGRLVCPGLLCRSFRSFRSLPSFPFSCFDLASTHVTALSVVLVHTKPLAKCSYLSLSVSKVLRTVSSSFNTDSRGRNLPVAQRVTKSNGLHRDVYYALCAVCSCSPYDKRGT